MRLREEGITIQAFRSKDKSTKSQTENNFYGVIWAANSIPAPACEFKFHPSRKWRIDFAWVDEKLAVEMEGAIWARGRHTRGAGFKKDMEKYNALVECGWALLRYEYSPHLGNFDFAQIKKVLESRCCKKSPDAPS